MLFNLHGVFLLGCQVFVEGVDQREYGHLAGSRVPGNHCCHIALSEVRAYPAAMFILRSCSVIDCSSSVLVTVYINSYHAILESVLSLHLVPVLEIRA